VNSIAVKIIFIKLNSLQGKIEDQKKIFKEDADFLFR